MARSSELPSYNEEFWAATYRRFQQLGDITYSLSDALAEALLVAELDERDLPSYNEEFWAATYRRAQQLSDLTDDLPHASAEPFLAPERDESDVPRGAGLSVPLSHPSRTPAQVAVPRGRTSMRIALIAPPWTPVPPAKYGGIEAVVDELARGYQAAGHEVLLCTTGDSDCPVPRHSTFAEAQGTKIGQIVPEMRHVVAAYEAVQDFDIVHDHTLLGPIYSERFPELAVVTTIHSALDDDLVELFGSIAGRVPLIAISTSQVEGVRRLPVAAVIHHGLDASRFPFVDGPRDYALFVGRMAPEKGARPAIDAATRARMPLVLAGGMRSPEERAYFEDEVEPHLAEHNVFYVGEVSHQRKLELLSNARCLLFPIAWQEPFGIVLLQALACGTPVVGFGRGAVAEIVDHGRTGFLCRDEQEMAEAIHRSAEIDPAACRQAVEGYFSARRMVADHLNLFERILARRRHAGARAAGE